MFNYTNIFPTEFEEICHEILEKITNQSFRVFSQGTDGGIDMQSNENEKIIGQAKLYINSTQSTTVYNIKKEFNRIRNKDIEQYYLFIGRELSPENVQKIYDEFSDYMKSKENIYTIKEIEELLQKDEFLDIIRNHVRLWLNSTNVLELVINRNIFFDNDILFYDIKKDLELFVQTEIYDVCKKILKEKRNLLILGEPGIGKTITSKMLALYFFQKGYTIRYADSQNLDKLKSGISMDYAKKEFILLDDCLGQSYLELHEQNENDLIRFIKYVQNNPNKIILLNSRITVFQEATKRKIDLEKSVNNKNFHIQEINMQNLSKLEKAQILYSYLKNKKIPEEYKKQIINNRKYMEIIKNPSYNPRIIDYMTDENRYSNIEPKKYADEIIKAFTKSEYVWEDEFKYRIAKQDRILLYTLYSISSYKVKDKILKQAFFKRLEIENIDTTISSIYEDTLKRLNESFIKIIMKDNIRYISVVNTSVNDFLKNKLNENYIKKEKLKKSIITIEQCERIIENDEDKEMFIREKIKNRDFFKLYTNKYNSINEVYLAYVSVLDMINYTDSCDIINGMKSLQGSYTVLDRYITNNEIVYYLHNHLEYKDVIEKFLEKGHNIIQLLKGMWWLDEQVDLFELISNINAEKITNKEDVIKFVEEKLKDEIRNFSEDIIEMNVGLDDIVGEEIEILKTDFEYDERISQMYDDNIFKKELFTKVTKSFKWACAKYIEQLTNNIICQLPDFIFYKLKAINVEDYINNDMIEKFATTYINLVYNTPDEDYTYYKIYIFDGHLLNDPKNEEDLEIHKIFSKII